MLRRSVLIHNPQFINSTGSHNTKKLSADTKKTLVELKHPKLRNWAYMTHHGLFQVDDRNMWDNCVKVNKFVLVFMKNIPANIRQCVKDAVLESPFFIAKVLR